MSPLSPSPALPTRLCPGWMFLHGLYLPSPFTLGMQWPGMAVAAGGHLLLGFALADLLFSSVTALTVLGSSLGSWGRAQRGAVFGPCQWRSQPQQLRMRIPLAHRTQTPHQKRPPKGSRAHGSRAAQELKPSGCGRGEGARQRPPRGGSPPSL